MPPASAWLLAALLAAAAATASGGAAGAEGGPRGVAAAAPPAWKWRWRRGALAAGGDVGRDSSVRVADATARCAAWAACGGITYEAPELHPAENVTVFYKERGVAANADPRWWSLVKDYPPDARCPALHAVTLPGLYDPAGLLLVNGTWHAWEDSYAWGHWTSRDLVHWTLRDATGFSGLTGSVSPTPDGSGFVALYPPDGKQRSIVARKATSPALDTWDDVLVDAILRPNRTGVLGFRDPSRAFEWNGSWYVGVGCGVGKPGPFTAGMLSWWRATNDELTAFEPAGKAPGGELCDAMFVVNMTDGHQDWNVQWHPDPILEYFLECPDVFKLGDRVVVIGAMFTVTQWWVGMLSDDGSVFTPESTGVLDYGNFYAPRTATGVEQTPDGRRVLFAFNGWHQPTFTPGLNCSRSFTFPRDIKLERDKEGKPFVGIRPVPELGRLRVAGSHVRKHADGAALVTGGRLEVRLKCLWLRAPKTGVAYVSVLQESSVAGPVMNVGYNFTSQSMYVWHADSSPRGTVPTILQNAPVARSDLDGKLEMAIYVDGGMLEAFALPYVSITALANLERVSGLDGLANTLHVAAAGVHCTADAWRLALEEVWGVV